MYSTKLVNKNVVQGNAYITVGDPYFDPKPSPFRALKKGETRPKAFHFQEAVRGVESEYFTKTRYVNDGYKENNKYITTQPLDSRKRGFGTRDASRRDEFSNSIRTAQYRESIEKEKTINALNAQVIKQKLTNLLAERAKLDSSLSKSGFGASQSSLSSSNGFDYSQRIAQYDIGRTRVTPFDPKTTKDTYYKFDDDRPKRYGSTGAPVSCDVGSNAWNTQYKPPKHGGRSEVKNFFDKSHLTTTND